MKAVRPKKGIVDGCGSQRAAENVVRKPLHARSGRLDLALKESDVFGRGSRAFWRSFFRPQRTSDAVTGWSGMAFRSGWTNGQLDGKVAPRMNCEAWKL